jgi:hypothetical protein
LHGIVSAEPMKHDEFRRALIADTAMLDPGRAVPAIRRMRERWQKALLRPDELLLLMEARGLLETAAALKDYVESL